MFFGVQESADESRRLPAAGIPGPGWLPRFLHFNFYNFFVNQNKTDLVLLLKVCRKRGFCNGLGNMPLGSPPLPPNPAPMAQHGNHMMQHQVSKISSQTFFSQQKMLIFSNGFVIFVGFFRGRLIWGV